MDLYLAMPVQMLQVCEIQLFSILCLIRVEEYHDQSMDHSDQDTVSLVCA